MDIPSFLLDGSGAAILSATALAWKENPHVQAAWALGPLAWGRRPKHPEVDLAVLMTEDAAADPRPIEAVLRALLRCDTVRLTCLDPTAASDASRLLVEARLLYCRDQVAVEVFLWRILVEAAEEEAHVHGLRARQRQIGMVRGRESPDVMTALAGELHLCIDALRHLAGLAASTFTPEPEAPRFARQMITHEESMARLSSWLLPALTLEHWVLRTLRLVIEVAALVAVERGLTPEATHANLLGPLVWAGGLDPRVGEDLQRWMDRRSEVFHWLPFDAAASLHLDLEWLIPHLDALLASARRLGSRPMPDPPARPGSRPARGTLTRGVPPDVADSIAATCRSYPAVVAAFALEGRDPGGEVVRGTADVAVLAGGTGDPLMNDLRADLAGALGVTLRDMIRLQGSSVEIACRVLRHGQLVFCRDDRALQVFTWRTLVAATLGAGHARVIRELSRGFASKPERWHFGWWPSGGFELSIAPWVLRTVAQRPWEDLAGLGSPKSGAHVEGAARSRSTLTLEGIEAHGVIPYCIELALAILVRRVAWVICTRGLPLPGPAQFVLQPLVRAGLVEPKLADRVQPWIDLRGGIAHLHDRGRDQWLHRQLPLLVAELELVEKSLQAAWPTQSPRAGGHGLDPATLSGGPPSSPPPLIPAEDRVPIPRPPRRREPEADLPRRLPPGRPLRRRRPRG